MAVAKLVQTTVLFCFSAFWASFVLLRCAWQFLTKRDKFLYLKKRDTPPKFLYDDSFGTHHYIKLKEVKLHYVANGGEDKPLMLCLHGFPEFWYSWRYQLTEFSKEYRVVAVDMRGYGDSDKPSGIGAYTMDKLTGDVKELIEALGYSKAVVAAHDWGGAVAWSFTIQYPELVDKLVICNIPHPSAFQKVIRSSFKQFLMSWYVFFFQIPYLPEWYLRTDDMSMVKFLYKKPMGMKPGKMTEDDIEAYKYIFSRPGALTGPVNYYRAALQHPPPRRQSYKITTVPVLLVWGNKDQALSTEMAALSGNYVSNFTLKYVDDTSHWVQQEEPKIVNQHMWEFLKQE